MLQDSVVQDSVVQDSVVQDSGVVLNNKPDEETTGEDIQTILESPQYVEEPLIEEDVFIAEQSKRPIYKSIPLKALLAGTVAMVLLVPFLLLFSGNILKEAAPNGSEEGTDFVAGPEETEEEKALRESELANSELKRQLALQNQSFTAAELDEQAAREQETQNQTNGPSTTTTRPPATTANPADIRTSRPLPPAQPVAATRPAPPPPPPSRTPPLRTSPPPAPLVRPTPPIRTPAPVSVSRTGSNRPTVDIAELSNNGSYGSLPVTDRNTFSSLSGGTRSGADTAMLVASNRAIPVATKSEGSLDAETGEEQPVVSHQTVSDYDLERAMIMDDEPESAGVTPATIFPGSTAEGQINRPVSWTPEMPSLQGSIVLSSPLVSDGYEILAAGTEIIVEIAAFSQSGAVDLRPVSIVLPEASALHISIPVEAIQILADDGRYPIAQVESASEVALRRIDRQQAFLGALSGAGSFINRPNSESGVVGIGGSSYNRDYGDGGSVLAAILSGAADEVLNGRSERLAAQAELLAERPAIWTLPAGTPVQILIKQEVQL